MRNKKNIENKKKFDAEGKFDARWDDKLKFFFKGPYGNFYLREKSFLEFGRI